MGRKPRPSAELRATSIQGTRGAPFFTLRLVHCVPIHGGGRCEAMLLVITACSIRGAFAALSPAIIDFHPWPSEHAQAIDATRDKLLSMAATLRAAHSAIASEQHLANGGMHLASQLSSPMLPAVGRGSSPILGGPLYMSMCLSSMPSATNISLCMNAASSSTALTVPNTSTPLSSHEPPLTSLTELNGTPIRSATVITSSTDGLYRLCEQPSGGVRILCGMDIL